MGMSYYVRGFIPDTDETYQKHKAVLVACHQAGIEELPKETAQYFGEDFAELYLLEEKLEIDIPLKEWSDDCREGYELSVSDIPQGVSKIRFYVSY